MQLNVLGPVEVHLPNGCLRVQGTRRIALLAALLLHPKQFVSTERLIDSIWDESPPTSASANVRTYVSGLRKLLGRTSDGRPRLMSYASGYFIEIEPDELDLLLFEELAAEGDRAAKVGDAERAVRWFDGAASLWRGRPFDGVELGLWAQAKVAALEERRCEVLSSWVEARLQLGDIDGLAASLREMLAERPLSERTWAQLMITLDQAGRTADALAAFAQARTVLVNQLGLDPGPELRGIHETILSRDRLPVSAGLRPAPARAAERVRPCSLPAVAPDFVGRDAQTRALTALLTPSNRQVDNTVAAVSGGPGTGKTALAVRTAHLLRPVFPDGQLYYALGGSCPAPVPPSVVLAEFLRSLGVDPPHIPHGTEDRAALYRTRLADRKVLVILDDATDISQLRPLLPGAGASRALASSRLRLTALEGAHPVDLGPLDDEEAIRLLRAIVGSSRVAREPDATRRIARACACLPLALRIAGARLAMRPLLPMVVFADRLDDERTRLDELAVGELSVRARLSGSYRALSRAARRAFRLIGALGEVSVSPALLAYALNWSEADADRSIEDLVRANLLTPVERPPNGELSYRLGGLLGLYAHECAEAEDLTTEEPAAGHRSAVRLEQVRHA